MPFRLTRAVFAALLLLTISSPVLAQSGRGHPQKRQHRVSFKVPGGWPQKFTMPRFSVVAPVENLNFVNPKSVHAPYHWGDVAWFTRGPKPGDFGHAQMYGHLDSTCCPAVFYHLRDMKAGDTVRVFYKKSKPLNFRIMWVHVYPNSKLPVKWIGSASRQRGMVMLTCTGVYHTDGTGYDHKFMAYARLVLPNGKLG